MIKVEHLTKKYGKVYALKDISFTVEKGEIVGFLGPNGAGKTTTMNIITGYLSSTSGSVSIDGCDILDAPSQAKSRIGYLPEQPPLYLNMTVNEYLNFIYELKGCLLPKEKHLSEVCDLTGITKVRHRLIGNLSKGYRQRVGIAQALVCNPPVLILDEPTIGLDPAQIIEIRSLIRKLGVKHTVILSSHILSEVQAICGRIIMLDHGKVVADSSTSELGKSTFGNVLNISVEGPVKDICAVLKNIKGITKIETRPQKSASIAELSLSCDTGNDVRRAIFNSMAENKWAILEIRSSEPSLEDIFMSLTAKEEN